MTVRCFPAGAASACASWCSALTMTIHFVETYLPKQQWSIKPLCGRNLPRCAGRRTASARRWTCKTGRGSRRSLPSGRTQTAPAFWTPSAKRCAAAAGCRSPAASAARSMRPEICPMPSGRRAPTAGTASSTPIPPLRRNLWPTSATSARVLLYGRGRYSSSSQGVQLPRTSPRGGRFFADITRAATLPSPQTRLFWTCFHA